MEGADGGAAGTENHRSGVRDLICMCMQKIANIKMTPFSQIMREQFRKQEDFNTSIEEVTKEKSKVEAEANKLKLEKKKVEEETDKLLKERRKVGIENDKLKLENKNLKSKLQKLVSHCQKLTEEVRGIKSNSSGGIAEAGSNVPPNNPLKRKTPSPSPPLVQEDDSPMVGRTNRSSRMALFSSRSRRRGSADEALVSHDTTEDHLDSSSFVPDTLQMIPSCDKKTLPVPVSRRTRSSQGQDPELSSTQHISQVASPAIVRKCRKKAKNISNKDDVKSDNFEGPGENKAVRKLSRKKSNSSSIPDFIPDSEGMLADDGPPRSSSTARRVGKILPSAQSEIDKKSFHDLDQDFALKEKENTPLKKKKAPVKYFPSDTDSDFESPNLLARKPLKKITKGKSKRETKAPVPVTKEQPEVIIESKDSDIDVFASQEEIEVLEVQTPKPIKKSKSGSVKAQNKWGLERLSLEDLTPSERKGFSSNKQSKIDGFFKNPPRQQSGDFVRVSHVDTDLERALQLSKEAEDSGPGDKERRTGAEKEAGTGRSDLNDQRKLPGPDFAHIGPVVRRKEERRKLNGYSCPECDEYYQQKLEEGLTKDQILQLMNKCSKHRGLFKPPLTPEKYWDPDIIEDDPSDPRVKTQPGGQLRTRAVRRAEKRNKMRGLELEEK